ncbi:MAG TPA: glycosyltransferase family 4 protein [Acidimicrobiales bacterium]|nr:glycosyltransferase family 4 protein [Acidimicrobiales bacterium]
MAVLQLGGDPPTASAPPSAGQTVVFAGYISPAKGLDTLVEAWKLGKCYQHLQLRVAGHASATHLAYAEKQRSALFAFDPESQWLGFVSDERLKDLIAQAAVVVLPYRQSSAASGVLSRAMVEGRAVIATPVPALIPHVTNRSTGIVIPVDDPAALASAIEELAGDATLRDALGSAAAIHAAQEFTWSAQVDGLLSVFNGG